MPLSNLRQSIPLALAFLCRTRLLTKRLGLRWPTLLMDYPNMRAGLLAMSTFGLASCSPVDWLHCRLCRWQLRR